MSEHAWIITSGVYTDIDLAAIGIDAHPKRVMAYSLSDIGRYLLFPGPIEVESRLLGCECSLKPTGWKHLQAAATRLIPWKHKSAHPSESDDRRLLLAQHFVRIPSLQDPALARHIDRLRSMLHPLDPVVQEIAAQNLRYLWDIRGVCEDEGGHRTYINLAGDLETKRRYVIDHLLKVVPITLPHARIADGLYDMRGLRPEGYRSERQHRFLKFYVKGRFSGCLLNPAGQVDFWIDDLHGLHHLHLLEQALETNPVFKSSFESCLQGDARALRLMINHEMDIDYSRNRLPKVYQELFHTLKLDGTQQQGVIRSLNTHQMGISFSLVPQEGFGDPQAVTSISVMHDLKALESIRQDAPQLYDEINRKATMSEAGKYYLLESIKGRPDEEGL